MLKRTRVLGLVGLVAMSLAARGNGPAAADRIDVIRSIPYADRGEKRLLADLYRPRKHQQALPVILMVHGGAWFTGNKVHVTLHARHAANAGFAVVAINYRLAPQHKFPAQVADCRAALCWIRDNAEKYQFDLSRVAAYGYSAGAHLACLLGTTSRDPQVGVASDEELPEIRAVVAGGSPCEFSWVPEQSSALAYWLGASRAENPEVYMAASPTHHIDAADPPVFFFHGSADRVVPLSSPRRMMQELAAKGVHADLYVVERAGHIETFLREEPRRRAIKFLNASLSPDTDED